MNNSRQEIISRPRQQETSRNPKGSLVSRRYHASRKHVRARWLAASVGALLLSAQPVMADIYDWLNPGLGNFSNANNWVNENGGAQSVPTSGNIANVISNGTAVISGSDNFTVDEFWAGNGPNNGGNQGAGNLQMSGGAFTVNNWFVVGRGGATGSATFTGGTINKNVNGGDFIIGDGTGSTGAMTMSDTTGTNTGTVINNNNFFEVGNGGNAVGSFTLNGGTITNGQEFRVGNGGTSQGTFTMTGGVVNTPVFAVATFGTSTGTVNQSAGAINATGGGESRIGGAGGAGDSGTMANYNLSGGTFSVGANLQIGAYGKGTLTQTGGVATSTGYVSVGRFAGGVGVVNVTGGAFNQTTAANRLIVSGESGTGTISVGSTSTTNGVINAAGGLLIGQNSGAIGTFNLNSGGTFVTGYVNAGSGTSTFNFNGGTLKPNASSTAFFTGVQSTNVLAGGARIDTAGFDVTVAPALAHGGAGTDGGLTKSGAGTLTLAASSTYNGQTSLTGGTLVVTGAIGAGAGGAGAFNGSQGTILSGTGTINAGANAITIAGTLSPGPTPDAGSVSVTPLKLLTTGALTLTSTATLAFDITNAGSKDLIMASGAQLSLSGTLALNLGNGFDYGQTYTLITGLASETGSFASVTGYNSMAYAPKFSFTGGNYNLAFTAVPEPSTWVAGLLAGAVGMICWRRRAVPALRP